MKTKEQKAAHSRKVSERYQMLRYGNLDRLKPGFRQTKPRAEVEIEFYHMAALTEDDLTPALPYTEDKKV